MRRDIKLVEENFYEALKILGYVCCNKREADQEWRRRQFHLFIRRKKKSTFTLSLHEDMPSSLPPFHRARHKSKTLEQELTKILDAYQKRRQANEP